MSLKDDGIDLDYVIGSSNLKQLLMVWKKRTKKSTTILAIVEDWLFIKLKRTFSLC